MHLASLHNQSLNSQKYQICQTATTHRLTRLHIGRIELNWPQSRVFILFQSILFSPLYRLSTSQQCTRLDQAVAVVKPFL